MSNTTPQPTTRRTVFLVFLILLSFVLVLVALMLPTLSRNMSPTLQVGQVAAQDYRAPTDNSFVSQVLTDQRREAAADGVQPVYTPADTSISRQQLEKLRTSLAYITSVRADSLASINQKMEDLAAMEDVDLSQETAFSILALSDSRWQIVQQETLAVLEKVMRSAIRPEGVDLARFRIPTLVSLSLPEEQVILVSELVTPYVVSNSEYSESLTEGGRENARDAVTPVTRDYVAGEMIVRGGRVLSEADLEALEQLGVIEPQQTWEEWIAASALALVMTVFVILYLLREPELAHDLRALTLILFLFFIFLYAARLLIPAHTVIPYGFPLSAFGLTVAALFGPQLAIVFSLPLAILVTFGMPNALDLTLFYLLGGLMGILALRRASRLADFFWAGAAFTVTGILVIVAYRLLLPSTDALGMATLAGASLFNGLVTASLGILLQFFLAQFLGKTTPMQLMELTRPDQPLLQLILREAPGTYQHSLQLANLVEQASERIGADPLLTRVGALYHDAGKALNSLFFIENQMPGFPNPHDTLDPETSAQIIIRHVTDGLELGKEYRLPRRILDFIDEHHGTMITRYQYINAVKAAGGDETKVDKSLFQYPGPRPQSRETAILMLADGCEARVRAERPVDQNQLQEMIKDVIDNRLSAGQLDDTDLTLNDLDKILDSFTATLKGIYHPRVKYPQLDQPVPTKADLPAPSEEHLTVLSPQDANETSNVQVNTPIDTSST